jgi:flagellar L-ring protein precursor FlgH
MRITATALALSLLWPAVAPQAPAAESGSRRELREKADAEAREELRAGEDSIWGDDNFLRDVEVREHDLVTIVIKESNTATTSLETEYEKDFEAKLDIAKAFNIKTGNGGKGLRYEPLTATSKKPEIDISAGRKHEGEGEIKHQEKFEARITAEVIEVLPNDTLMIEARKRVTIGEERSELILTGRIRPQDIRAGNTVDSDRVADSHIQYRPKGAVGDANKRGWLHRLFDFVNIF